jgi:hypothetical protein
MKVFEFERKMKKENGDVNLIYIQNDAHIVTLKGRSNLSEVVKDQLVTYPDTETLIEKSEQYLRHRTLPTFKVIQNDSDASKWKVDAL